MDDIIIERNFAYSIDKVWLALTDPSALADWLMPGDFKPIVGHKFQFRTKPHAEHNGLVDVEILEVQQPHRLSYSWKTSNMQKPTTVTFILSATPDGGTLLRLEHKGFEGASGEVMQPLYKNGWGYKFDSMLEPVIARLAQKN